MNKFDQVSSDDHQISLVGSQVWCMEGELGLGDTRSDVQKGVPNVMFEGGAGGVPHLMSRWLGAKGNGQNVFYSITPVHPG